MAGVIVRSMGYGPGGDNMPVSSPDVLLAEACRTTDLVEMGPPGWENGLAALVSSANSDGELAEVGVRVFESWIGIRLRNRLRVVNWAHEHGEEVASPVQRPLVVTGLGRSGTTYLLELLASDHRNRALMNWEAFDSVPPPERESLETDPRIRAQVVATEQAYDASPALRAVHYEPGDGPVECRALLGQSFRCSDFPGMFTLPSYLRWYLQADPAPAYEFHRLALAVLQSRAPGPWVLKDPWHLTALDALVKTYPDARIVVLHRDPVEVVASLAGLFRATSADRLRQRPVEPTFWGAQALDLLGAAADNELESRQRLPPDHFLDVNYRDLVREPIRIVEQVYAHAGRAFTAAAESTIAMQVADRPQNRYGVHRYSAEAVGLHPAGIRERFATYVSHQL
jgi:hypothetical protein